MKRLRRFLPLLALVAITVVIVRWRAARQGWHRLPGGGDVRLLAVTHGRRHAVEFRGFSWRDRAGMAWRNRSFHPFARRGPGSDSATTKTPSLIFWFEHRHLPRESPDSPGAALWSSDLQQAGLLLPDGQAFQAPTGSPSPPPDAHNYFPWRVTFPILPARARTLHLVTHFKGGRQEFNVPNPAFRPDLPVWKADRLPQTKRRGNVALTLRGVKLTHTFHEQTEDALVNWHAEPLWDIALGAVGGDRFHRIDAVFEDPAGNASSHVGLFSEPVWKVRATIIRRNSFPFPENEVRWIGRIDPAVPEVQTRQGYTLLPLPARSPVGLKLVGVFGPGTFEIKNGAVTPAEPQAEAGEETEWEHVRGVWIVRLARPAVILLEDHSGGLDETVDLRVVRDEAGADAPLETRRWEAATSLWIKVFNLPEKPVRFGFGEPDSFELEFFIPAPARPPLKAPAVGR